MNKKAGYLLLTVVYLIAVGMNLMVSIKYPDSVIGVEHLMMSIFFILSMLVICFFGSTRFSKFLLAGVFSGIFISLVQNYFDFIYEIWILDVISNLQYPLYVLFFIPLFGLNYLLDYSLAMFSLVISIIFIMLYIVLKINMTKKVQII